MHVSPPHPGNKHTCIPLLKFSSYPTDEPSSMGSSLTAVLSIHSHPVPLPYQLSLSKQLAPLCLSTYSHCLHSLALKVLKHCLQENPALSPHWKPELCSPCGFLPAPGCRLLNPAALSPLSSLMIIPFSLFPCHCLCTVDFPSQTRKGRAEEAQGHSCLSNPMQDHLVKPGEFLL